MKNSIVCLICSIAVTAKSILENDVSGCFIGLAWVSIWSVFLGHDIGESKQ